MGTIKKNTINKIEFMNLLVKVWEIIEKINYKLKYCVGLAGSQIQRSNTSLHIKHIISRSVVTISQLTNLSIYYCYVQSIVWSINQIRCAINPFASCYKVAVSSPCLIWNKRRRRRQRRAKTNGRSRWNIGSSHRGASIFFLIAKEITQRALTIFQRCI